MLTRLEIDGFKNLVGVVVELGPFTCVAGANGVGKSNLFDAIRFLSLLADHKLVDAARRVRGADDDPTDPRELFTRSGTGDPELPMRFAVEMIVPAAARDSYGRNGDAAITFLRYELELAYELPRGDERTGRIVLRREDLSHINQNEASGHIRWPHNAGIFRRAVVTGFRRGGKFISTTEEAEKGTLVRIHADGGSRGLGKPANAAGATATMIGATSSVDDPTVFCAKTEMVSWRHLALEPSAMRRPDKYWEAGEAPSVNESGAHIPATLWHLGVVTGDRDAIFAEVASTLSDLLPVQEIRVIPNDANQQYELQLREPGGVWLGARALSEGTLRFLALATISADPESARLLCMEEPENGIHPSRIPAMLRMLTAIAVDPLRPPGSDNPVRQVLINTHSPRMVQHLEAANRAADLLIAEPADVRGPHGVIRTVRFRHRKGTWREREGDGVGPGLAIAYLTVPVGGQAPLLVAEPG